MTDITIPPEALEAARRAYELNVRLLGRDPLSAACLAMLRAWPGVSRKTSIQGFVTAITVDEDAIILPLPQEASDV